MNGTRSSRWTAILLPLIALGLIVAGCVTATSGPATGTSGPGAESPSPSAETGCVATDQDRYVWRPARLEVLEPCVRVTGVVRELGPGEADGDTHIHVQVDAPYQSLLAPGNQDTGGYLVVEAVCQAIPAHIEALRLCASDPDPYPRPLPQIGQHVWIEGRSVLDLWHHSWAELHPLYRWGPVTP